MLVAATHGDFLIQIGLVILILVGALFWLTRLRRGVGARGGRIVMLTGQHALHEVEMGGRRFVVGTGPSGAPRYVCDLQAGEAGERERV